MKTKKKIRRTDEEVIACGELVAEGSTALEIERTLEIPHSTVHWIITHRLNHLDAGLYLRCVYVFFCHRHKIKPKPIEEWGKS